MPIYEYRCRHCEKSSSIFVRSVNDTRTPVCEYCAGIDMQRLISSFSHHRSLATVHGHSGPPPGYPSLDYYKDPRNIGRYVEDSFRKQGMAVPEGVQETIKAAREGELPKGVDF